MVTTVPFGKVIDALAMTEDYQSARDAQASYLRELLSAGAPNVFGIEPRSPAWGRSSAPMPCWAAIMPLVAIEWNIRDATCLR